MSLHGAGTRVGSGRRGSWKERAIRALVIVFASLTLAVAGCQLGDFGEPSPELDQADQVAETGIVLLTWGTVSTPPGWVILAVVGAIVGVTLLVNSIAYQREDAHVREIEDRSGKKIKTTCPKDIFDKLMAVQDVACATVGREEMTKCYPAESCPLLAAKAAAGTACLEARVRVQARCFGASGLPDEAHKQAIGDRSVMVSDCLMYTCLKGCLGCGGLGEAGYPLLQMDYDDLFDEPEIPTVSDYECPEGQMRCQPRTEPPYGPDCQPGYSCRQTCASAVAQHSVYMGEGTWVPDCIQGDSLAVSSAKTATGDPWWGGGGSGDSDPGSNWMKGSFADCNLCVANRVQ